MPLTLVDSPKSKRGGPSCRVHHYPIPVGYQPLADKYEKRFSTQPFSAKLVDPEDLQEALEGYATDLRFDLYSLMEVFKCSRQTLYTMLQSKEFAPIYEAAKESRADLALQRGHEVLEQTYHDALNGDIGRDAVNAAKNLANYNLSFAQITSSRYNRRGSDGDLNVQINVPKFGGAEGDEPVEVEAEIVDEQPRTDA